MKTRRIESQIVHDAKELNLNDAVYIQCDAEMDQDKFLEALKSKQMVNIGSAMAELVGQAVQGILTVVTETKPAKILLPVTSHFVHRYGQAIYKEYKDVWNEEDGMYEQVGIGEPIGRSPNIIGVFVQILAEL